MAKQDDFNKFMSKMGDSVQKRLDNPGFCRFCGQPLELTDQGQDQFQWESKHQVHMACARHAAMRQRRGE